jgi:predicted transcriptional regulator
MILHGHTNKDIANLLGISEQSVSSKINENGTEFKQGEIKMIADEYNLTPEDIADIFFN